MQTPEGQTHRFDTFVGIDLGGGKGKNTAVALVQRRNGDARVSFVGTRTPGGSPFYDAQLLDFVRQHSPERTLVAIDAPLTLPVCVRCRLETCVGLDGCRDNVIGWFRNRGRELVLGPEARSSTKPPTTPYTQRACEVVLHRKHGVLPRETLGQGMGPLTARAHYLRRALESQYRLNENLIEVYPKATVHVLFDGDRARSYKRQVDAWGTRAQMLEALSHRLRFDVWREGCLSNDHCFDAVLCAYTGYLCDEQGWNMPQQDRDIFDVDGWIWFPPARSED